jgi:hypothetical protein
LRRTNFLSRYVRDMAGPRLARGKIVSNIDSQSVRRLVTPVAVLEAFAATQSNKANKVRPALRVPSRGWPRC